VVPVRLQRGDEVVARGEERPARPVAERYSDLLEKSLLGPPVGRVEREHLLELVEHQQ
jgi:hypothetical protein